MADGEPFDLAEPALAFGFDDAGGEVVADLEQAGSLGEFRAQGGAADAGLTEMIMVNEMFCNIVSTHGE